MNSIPSAARSWSRLLLICLLTLTAISCGDRSAPQAPPPPMVSVAKPVMHEVTDYLFYNGITRGEQTNEVRPQVAGYLEKISFRPDSQVKKGDLLCTIDQREYKIAVQRAQAELLGKQAAVDSAKSNLERLKRMVSQQAASDQELIDKQSAYDLAVAEVDVARTELHDAQRKLDYTEVRAKIGGRISRNRVDEGTLLKADETILATIVNDNQIYVDFQVSEAEFLDYIRKNPLSRTEDANKMPPVVVEMGMADQAGYPRTGRVIYGDNTLNSATATFAVSALFENEDKQIAPGLYVRVRVLMGSSQAMLVPDVAVQADQRGNFVWVVDDENIVHRRAVRAGTQAGEYRRIIEGLTPQDRLIINGLQRARPDAPVTPQDVPLPPLPAASQPTTAPTTAPTATIEAR